MSGQIGPWDKQAPKELYTSRFRAKYLRLSYLILAVILLVGIFLGYSYFASKKLYNLGLESITKEDWTKAKEYLYEAKDKGKIFYKDGPKVYSDKMNDFSNRLLDNAKIYYNKKDYRNAYEAIFKIPQDALVYNQGQYVIKAINDVRDKKIEEINRYIENKDYELAANTMGEYRMTFDYGDSISRIEQKEKVINEILQKINKEQGTKDLLVYVKNDIRYIMWSKDKANIDSNIDIDISGDGRKEFFRIGKNSPNGTKITATYENVGCNLIDLLSNVNPNAFDEFEELSDRYFIQMSFYDFNKDGIKEVIVAIGDKVENLDVYIFRLVRDSVSKPYELIGRVEGQNKVEISEKGRILAPYGSQGLFKEYICDGTKVYKAE